MTTLVTLEETTRYRITSIDNRAAIEIMRLEDGASVLIQGANVMDFELSYDWADAKARDQCDRDTKMDMICEEYDSLMA